MSCISTYTLTGILNDCNPNLAGIKEIYLAYDGDFEATPATGAHSISALTRADATATSSFHKYEFARTTGSLTSTLTKDEANGTRYYTNEIALQFNKMEATKHLEIEAMAAEHLTAIVADNNGKFWYVGTVEGVSGGYLSGTAATAQSGAGYDDLNGYNVTLNAMSGELPFEISKSLFESYIA